MTLLDKMKKRGVVPKAVLYARFSSDNQREESIEAQLRALYDFCKKNNVVVIAEYIDRAKSATSDDRPEFLKMIKDAKHGGFDFVIVHKLDRFARNRTDSSIYRYELNKHGVEIISVIENFDDSPESYMMMGVMETINEYYSANLAREVRKGLLENAYKCMATGGTPPFGLKIDPKTKRYVINEDEAPAIVHIFESVKNGVGYGQITNELNVMGYVTRFGKPFGKNSLHEILRNEKYKGVFIYNRAVSRDKRGRRNYHKSKYEEDIIRIEGGVEAIIDPETFDMVAKIIASRRRDTPSNAKEVYLLTGKMFCSECGAAYIGNRKQPWKGGNVYVVYRCGGRSLKASVHCHNKEIRRELIEDFVIRELARVIFNPETIDEIIRSYSSFSEKNNKAEFEKQEAIRKNISAVKLKITNLVSVMANTGSSTLVSALEELEQEQRKLEGDLANKLTGTAATFVDEDKIRKAYALAREQFLNGTLKERQLLINHYVNKVVIFEDNVEVYLNRLPTYLTRLTELDFPNPVSGTKAKSNRAQTGPVAVVAGAGEGT